MSEQARARLQKMLDLLEPNVWLELDEVSFPRFFDGPLRRASDQFEATQAFAKRHGAVAIFQSNPRVVKFGRACIKRDDDASPQEGPTRRQPTRQVHRGHRHGRDERP